MNQKDFLLEENTEIIPLLCSIMNKCNKLILSIHHFMGESEDEDRLVANLKKIVADIESKLLVIFFKDTTVTFYDPNGQLEPKKANISEIVNQYGVDKAMGYINNFLTASPKERSELWGKAIGAK